jgi:pimeloyl-ACP methyl ester carboxylesterase
MSIQRWKKCFFTLCTFVTILLPQTPAQDSITGEWNGVLAGKLRVIIRIQKAADQSYHGTLESLDQGGATVAMDEVSFDGAQVVRFNWKQMGASFSGQVSSDGSEITGAFRQGTASLPLILKRPGTAPPAAPAATLKSVTRGRVPLDPCLASDGATQALCGTYEVYENRASRTGRKIALNLMIMPALARRPAPDPVFGFAGGPGQSAVRTFPLVAFMKALQQDHDIVLIDQRGTGKSNPLPCPVDASDVQALVSRAYSTENLPGCRAELEKRADLTQYTTTNSVDDVDEVREALGYDKIDVVGASYGSLASLVYLRRHSPHVRVMALQDVAGPDYRLPLPFAKTIQSALDHLFADCAADAGCHKSFPNLKTEFESIVERLDRQPAKFDFRNAATGEQRPITLSRGGFVSALRPLLYQPAVVSQLPYILDRAYRNDWNLFATVAVGMHRAMANEIARGMAFSVTCSESVPFISKADVRRETKGTYLGDFDVRTYQEVCRGWPHASVSKDFLAPVRSDVPVLLITGAEDSATPTSLAHHAVRGLSHGRVVVIPNGTHGTGARCIDNMITQFIKTGSDTGLDSTCVSQIHNPPFLTLEQVQKIRP